ncbi:MAG: hypothetical protein ACYCO5_00815 [Acidobacteriaceae bacterium]
MASLYVHDRARGQCSGAMTGEWKNAGKMPWHIQLVGVAILAIVVVVLSRARQPA